MAKYKEIKLKIYRIIEHGSHHNTLGHYFDHLMVLLIWLNVIVVIAESYESIRIEWNDFLYVFDLVSVTIFGIEYLLRLWTADLKYPHIKYKSKARLKFMLSFMAIIDLLSILPFFLPFFINADLRVVRVLRFMRVLRVFKMNRYSRSLLLFRDVILDKREELITTLFLTFILILLSSTVMYHIEHEKNPAHFPNIIESFWWSVVTITTVGYGDAVPQTGLGKTVASFIAFFGLIAVAMPTAIISAGFLDKLHEDRQKKENRKHKEFYYCPHCGEKLPTGMVIHENSEHHKHKKTNPDSHTEL